MDKQENQNQTNQRDEYYQPAILALFFCVAFCVFSGILLNMLHYEIISPVPSWLEKPAEFPLLSNLCISVVVMGCYFLLSVISERLKED